MSAFIHFVFTTGLFHKYHFLSQVPFFMSDFSGPSSSGPQLSSVRSLGAFPGSLFPSLLPPSLFPLGMDADGMCGL